MKNNQKQMKTVEIKHHVFKINQALSKTKYNQNIFPLLFVLASANKVCSLYMAFRKAQASDIKAIVDPCKGTKDTWNLFKA